MSFKYMFTHRIKCSKSRLDTNFDTNIIQTSSYNKINC